MTLCLSGSTAALAQQPPRPGAAAAPSDPVASPPPDIVRLKNGSLFRGIILELVIGDHVDILVPSGETRRFPTSDVDYAGPDVSRAHAAPPSSSPQAAPGDGVATQVVANDHSVQLQIEATESNIRITGSKVGAYAESNRYYAPVCTAPCNTPLPKGSPRLALSYKGRKPVEIERTIVLEGPGRLETEYTSRSDVRTLGLVVFLAGLAGAGTLIALGATKTTGACTFSSGSSGSCFDTSKPNYLMIGIGAGVAVLGGIVGGFLGFTPDKADARAVPRAIANRLQLAPTVFGSHYEGAARAHGLDGAGLVLRYEL